jgi:sugar phosphate isomerase/epimerase
MKLSVFTVMIGGDYDLEAAAELVKRTGYDAVEWRVQEDWHVPVSGIEEQAHHVAEVSRAAGLEIASLAPYVRASDPNAVESIMRAAQAMGVKQTRVGVPGYDGSTPYPELLDRAQRELNTIEVLARTYGVKGLVELHFGNIACSASLAKRLLEPFDPDCLGAIYDPGNMVVEGMVNWKLGLEVLGPHLAHVHVKNAAWFQQDGAWKWRWVPLEQGIVDWKQVVADLKAVGYDDYLSCEDFCELPPEEKLARNARMLKEWMG